MLVCIPTIIAGISTASGAFTLNVQVSDSIGGSTAAAIPMSIATPPPRPPAARDSQTPSSFPVSVDNVVREVLAASKTWKSYAEDLPSVGYTRGDSGNDYVRHNPLAYMTDVQNSPTQQQNLVPFTQFSTDVASGNLPDYSFIVPNAGDDAHNCELGAADNWLKTNINPLIKNPTFQNDGLLIIAFDESANDDTDGKSESRQS
jgi:phospholipase C